MRDPLPGFPGYSLRRAAYATAAELATRLAPLELRQSDLSVLILIGENPGVTASAIGRQLDIQRANMVPLLKRLEDAGRIGREPIDGKSQGLALTPVGRRTLAKGLALVEAFEAELLQRIPAEHRAHLLPALEALWR
ncbi:MAG: MarR family transcriptional regulator [Altererythrobacter sp.]|nr:MarR family transcriptional regulator [Altererythrobacter sp.]OJU59638.1 MAG: MarR family transcriptional regulator [Altererythrobacter sp. 66-12]